MADRLVHATERSDAELITAVRVGDIGAYEELYRRHVDAAMAVGRHLTGSKADAEDVVSEAFARVLSVLQRGAGPEMAFRPYLLTSVRNAFYDRTRKDKRLEVTDDVPEDLGRVLAAAAASDDDAERQMAATAFASLPERWQLVLWHTEVEGRSPAEVGPLLGLAPNAVAALAYRAREGLRQAYLNAHIQARPPAGCEDIVPKLGAYVRHDLSNRDRQKVEAHLEGCERCRAIVAELEEAGSRLKILLIPLIAGIPAAAYLSGIGAPGAGGVLALTRATQRVKDMGPAGQVAVALGSVAAAGLLVVGAVAAARSLTGGGPQQTVSEAGTGSSAGSAGSGSGGGGGGGSGSAGGSAGTTPSDVTPGSNAATQPPSATDVPVISPTSPAGSGSGSTSGQPPIIIPAPPRPSSPATNAPPATSPSPTSPATTAPVPPPTTAPPASLSVSLESAGPAYAGLGAAIPVTVGNDTSGAVALGPGRSVSAAAVQAAVVPAQAGPAVQPTVTIPLAPGVTFDGVDNPEWACTAAGGTLSCVLPALDPGATTAGLIQLGLPANATGTITLQPTIADGLEPPVVGPPLVLTVLPPPTGLSDLVIDHADLVLTGNGILTCDPAGAPFCVTARDDPAAAPAGRVDKSGQQMVWLDVDGDPATFNSSSADLSLPPDSTVLSARLLWGGTVQPGPGGSAPPSPTSTAVVQVTAPGGVVQQVTAPTVSTDPTSAARYVAAADVAALVAANGAGTYTVADLQTATGPGAFGGWALQVVYRDPAAPLRMVATTDQVATVNRGGSSSLVLSGLTPPTAAVTGTLSYAAVEGDYGIVPEQVAANGVPLSNAVNAPDNPMNGSISTPGARNPSFVNNFGFDVDQFPIDVAAGATEVRIDVTSSSDRFRVAATGVVIPL